MVYYAVYSMLPISVRDEVHTGASTDDSAMKGADELHCTPILWVEHCTSS